MAETLSLEQVFYIDAICYADDAAEIFETTEPAKVPEMLQGLRERYNAKCLAKGSIISIMSDGHHIDWSCGKSAQDVKDLPTETGDFEGYFIGYVDLAPTTISLGNRVLDLATVMSTNLRVPDFLHYADVLIITPIAGSDIRVL